MQPRILLPVALVAITLLAGCAQPEGAAAEFATDVTAQQAAELFAAAVANMPDRFGIHLQAVNDGARLMEADAVYDGPAGTMFLRAEMDPILTEAARSMGGALLPDLDEVSLYASPDGSAMLLGDEVYLAPPEGGVTEMAAGQQGFDVLADPEALFLGMEESGFEVENVSATTIRDRAALKVTAMTTEDGQRVPVSVWIFQEPARLARVQMTAPTTGDDPFSGGTVTLDVLYDDEIVAQPPAGLARALGLRFDSDAPAFGGFSREEDAPRETVWTFAVDGGIPLAEVRLEVDDAPFLTLADLTAERDGLTATFTDADEDGTVSAGDTLRIAGTDGQKLALHDTVTGLRVVPGGGLLLAALALAGVALLLRRR